MDTILLSSAAILLYVTSSILLSLRMVRGPDGLTIRKNPILLIGIAAVAVHAFLLYGDLFTRAGLNLGFTNATSLVTWLIALLLLVSAFSRPVESLGVILLPIAAVAILFGLFYPSKHLITEAGQWRLDLHIVISILAYSLLSLAAVQAILLAVQERQLRTRRLGAVIRALPPLQTMEGLLFRMIWSGFLLLSLALLTGFLFLEDMFAQHLVHKTVLSIFAWGIFGVLLWGRARFGWRGRTAIRWTLAGFVALMLAYFGSKAVLEFILNRP
ncbi:MAG: cytochrome c biogenesis protein CcsA [Chromatiales bacterium]|nr:cytochrome c biogenesis protein CcsA [Chromatiales bacterium]